jgi:TATA-binding related factor (TRF) of subunit 20 of Mediator complex
MQKMSPLWVPRQAHRVEGGVSFFVGDWKVRIGELKISGGQGQGRVKGCLCEVEFLDGNEDKDGTREEIVGLASAFFESLVQDSGVDVSGMKVIESTAHGEMRIVQQYMELLKFARS